MTAKADFSEQDWSTVLEGPPSAGMIVLTAAHGGTFKETFAIGKAYAEARQRHGESELLDEIVSAKPENRSHPVSLGRGTPRARAPAPPRRGRGARAQGDGR